MKILLESLKKASEKLTKYKELKSDEKAIKKIEEFKVEISLIKMKTLPGNFRILTTASNGLRKNAKNFIFNQNTEETQTVNIEHLNFSGKINSKVLNIMAETQANRKVS